MRRRTLGWGWLIGLGVLGTVGASGPGVARAQSPAGCTLQKQVYTCDRAAFREALAKAATAQVDPIAAGRDRMAAAKLRELIATLGKAAPPEGRPADLSFSLIPVDSAGVLVGPAGVELAVLRVYGPPAGRSDGADAGAARGTLLWAESFMGQPDMSWPATVQATINQFHAHFR